MARLNESAAPPESIEALKRRFVRQNRELARVNSIQSLRIRSLESEVSHLLSENVTFREQVIALSQEIERFEATRLLHHGIYDIKAKLESKLNELNNLVVDLGSLPRTFTQSYRENTETTGEKNSGQSSWELRQNTTKFESDMGTEQDGRLPIIPEENYYQRRLSGLYTIEGSLGKDASTLRLSETEDGPTNQSNANCDSTHLRSPECVTDSKTIGGDSSINDSMLPPTLETRKRRKYNTAWMDEATESEMFVSQSDTGTTQKSGFKRKFCAEDDEALESVPQEDDFQFTRPVSSPQLACERYVSLGTYSPVERPVELEKSSNNHKQPKRKALEPKSININLIPLNKRRSTTIEDQDQNASTKEDVENGGKQTPSPNVNAYCGQNISKPQRGFLYTNKPTQDGYGKNEHVIESKSTEGNLRPLPRQILAPEEHSAYQAPMDILDPPSRPTRRQRAVVSYTEPNLRDKMRRSNNEFIAAVGSDQPRRNSNSLPVRPHANDEADINKNSKASSKLLGSGTSDTPVGNPSTQKMSMVSQRKRKPSPSASKDVLSGVNDGFGWEEDTHFNNASFGTETEPEGNIITKSQSEDVKGCILQPPAEPTDISMTHARNASKSNTRLHKQPRRHSSNPSSSAQEPPVECDIIASPPSSRAILSPSAKAGQGHLRTQTMNENPVQSEAKSHEPGGHLIKSSTLEVKPRQIKRKQRPSARRKSMML